MAVYDLEIKLVLSFSVLLIFLMIFLRSVGHLTLFKFIFQLSINCSPLFYCQGRFQLSAEGF